MDGAYNTDCSSYANTHAVSGKCECDDGGYVRQSNGSCAIMGPDLPTNGSGCLSNCLAKDDNETECAAQCKVSDTSALDKTPTCDPSSSCWFYNCCSSTPD